MKIEDIKLESTYSSTQMRELYNSSKTNGYLQKSVFGCTVDKKFFHKFIISNIQYEFWEVEPDNFICTICGNNSIQSSESIFNYHSFDKKKNPKYYERRVNGQKEDWNPVTNIGGTGIKKNW